jgi:hypothetical protein
LKLGIVVLLENPLTSRFWLLPQIQALTDKYNGHEVICDFCQYGVPWLKPTKFLCFNLPADFQLKRCSGKSKMCSRSCLPHVPLSGTVKRCVSHQSCRTLSGPNVC